MDGATACGIKLLNTLRLRHDFKIWNGNCTGKAFISNGTIKHGRRWDLCKSAREKPEVRNAMLRVVSGCCPLTVYYFYSYYSSLDLCSSLGTWLQRVHRTLAYGWKIINILNLQNSQRNYNWNFPWVQVQLLLSVNQKMSRKNPCSTRIFEFYF